MATEQKKLDAVGSILARIKQACTFDELALVAKDADRLELRTGLRLLGITAAFVHRCKQIANESQSDT